MNAEPTAAESGSEHSAAPRTGTWHGMIKSDGHEVPFVLYIRKDEAGLVATADVPMRKGANLTGFAWKDRELRFRSMSFGDFCGQVIEEDHRIEGSFSQFGRQYPVTLHHGAPKATQAARPQNPRPPFSYDVEEVTMNGASAIVRLAGTLTIPKVPRAIALLVSGSGPCDRDQTFCGHKPFWVLADHLSRNGYAALRLDDRGVGGSTGDRTGITMGDEAADLSAAIDHVRQRADLRSPPIGLIGHSTGGLTATMIAAERSDVAFVVSLAGPGQPLAVGLTERECIELERSGIPADKVARYATFARAVREHVRELPPEVPIDAQQIAAIAETTGASPTAVALLSAPARLQQTNLPWFRHAFGLDPAVFLRRLRAPYLAMTGALDSQVVATSSLSAIQQVLRDSNHPDFETVELPGLNHLFQTCATGSILEYEGIEETFSPIALDRLIAWLDRHFGPR